MKIFKSTKYNIPIISIGNLRVGGSGKTPLIFFLLQHVFIDKKIGVLSKGYKRTLKKDTIITPTEQNSFQVGDEAFMLASVFPQHIHLVSKNKKRGIERLILMDVDAIVLDDAYHHREINFSKNILLTDIKNLFLKDFIMPMGNLREYARAAKRADCIVVTKCEEDFSIQEKTNIENKIKPYNQCQLFFTSIVYKKCVNIFYKNDSINFTPTQKIIAVHGLAQPEYFLDYLTQHFIIIKNFEYADHFKFQQSDVLNIVLYADQNPDAVVVCTQKDAVKLLMFKELLANKIRIYYLPIELKVLFQEKEKFIRLMQI